MKPIARPSLRLRPAMGRASIHGALLGAALVLGTACASLRAQSTLGTGEAIQVVNRDSNSLAYSLGSNGTNDGSLSNVQGSADFTGMDGGGSTQTMTLGGSASSSVTYGQLHLSASSTVTNSYYNASNPYLYDPDTGTFNPNGSPDTLSVLAFGTFSDTLQYGGALQAGYMARYIFHVDGSNNGPGAEANLTVTLAGRQTEFYNFAPGLLDTFYATPYAPVNGQTPQTVNVTFAASINLYLHDFADGSTFSSEANYSNTATLVGVEIVDANGNPVSGVTITSGSGTTYQTVVPEPSAWAAVLAGGGFLVLTLRRRTLP